MNLNNFFILIEIIDFDPDIIDLKFKVRYGNRELNKVIEMYNRLKNIITNPLVIINGYLTDIIDNNDIYKKISDCLTNKENQNIIIITIEKCSKHIDK